MNKKAIEIELAKIEKRLKKCGKNKDKKEFARLLTKRANLLLKSQGLESIGPVKITIIH